MSDEYLQDLVSSFAVGPVTSRQAVRDAFANMEIAVPAGVLPADAAPATVTYTLFAYVTDDAGQASILIYADATLPTKLGAALELMNGLAAAGPADVSSSAQVFALARVVALNNRGLSLQEWVREAELGDPECPDQAELDALAALAAVDSFVVNGDGSIWKHSPLPPKDLLDRTYSRVVSFHLAM